MAYYSNLYFNFLTKTKLGVNDYESLQNGFAREVRQFYYQPPPQATGNRC